jgi:hypothetical protein
MENKGSEDKIGVLDLRRAELLRKLGLKITPALREYCRYTGISAQVEKRRFPLCDDSQPTTPSEAPGHNAHRD